MAVPSLSLPTLGLQLADDLSPEQWQGLGEQLHQHDTVLQWAIGDWWAYGKRRYSEGEKIATALGFKLSTLENCAWVARSIENSRRRENLPFAYHETVAALPPDNQDELLDKAEWLTRLTLRRMVAEVKPDPTRPKPSPSRGVPPLYRTFVDIINDRLDELGMNHTNLGEAAGLQEGYVGHILTPDTPTGRIGGWDIIDRCLRALWPEGCSVTLVAASPRHTESTEAASQAQAH